MMKNFLFALHLLILLSANLFAEKAIEVDRVDFNSLRDDWIQVEIELSCRGNPSPEARNSRFVEYINVRVYLAWERDASEREYDYYTSEVDIVIMEQGDDNNVYFYLPGLIVDRDRLDTDPDFFYVEIFVNDERQEPESQTPAMSSNITNLQILEAFISKAESEAVDNEHLLMPIYLAPSGIDLGRVGSLPVFLRRDVRD